METNKKLEYKIRILKNKLKQARKQLEEAYAEGFQDGFNEGQTYQINEIELELFQPEGEAH